MKQIIIFLLFLFTFSINAQEQTPRIKIGYNIVPLISKSTDLFIETNITTSMALLINIGNTYAPVRGFYQKDDGVALEEMSGYFFKLGGKYAWLNKKKTDVWVGLSLIGSYNKESGTRSGIAVLSEGIVFGGAFITGMDIQLWHFLDLRMGCQSNLPSI